MNLPARLPSAAVLCLALAGLLVLAACDSADEPREVTFDGVTYVAVGEAELEVTDAGLVVSNIGTAGGDGVRVERERGLRDADVATQPVTIPDGARWGLQIFGALGGERTALAAAWADGTADGRHAINIEFADALGADSVRFEYLLGGVLVARSPSVPLGGLRARAAASGGSTNAKPQSTHATRTSKGVIVVGTDYGSSSSLGGGECPRGGVPIQTPFPEIPLPLCADFIRTIPLGQALYPEVTDLEVTGRSIEGFTITSETGIE